MELDTAQETQQLKQDIEKEDTQHLKGVHSIKVLRDSTINQDLNEPLPPLPQADTQSPISQPDNQGENTYAPEKVLDEDSLLEKIKEFKMKAKEDAETQYQRSVIKNSHC